MRYRNSGRWHLATLTARGAWRELHVGKALARGIDEAICVVRERNLGDRITFLVPNIALVSKSMYVTIYGLKWHTLFVVAYVRVSTENNKGTVGVTIYLHFIIGWLMSTLAIRSHMYQQRARNTTKNMNEKWRMRCLCGTRPA